ncbi:MAG: hypothetical protein QXD13_00885, partial [Candidatus Pacearchaeota archaeon]
MVHKRYVRKGGKVFGPYYYQSYRENGIAKKKYLGPSFSENKVVPQSNFKNNSVILPLIIFAALVIAGFLLYSQLTTKATLDIDANYAMNEKLSGKLSIAIEEGDSIQKDALIEISLEKNEEVISETTKTIEEFLNGQIMPVEVTSIEQVCENVSVGGTTEVCTNETITIQNCVNETTTNENNEIIVNEVCVPEEVANQTCVLQQNPEMQEICTETNITDYYYQTAGTYSRNIEDFIDYTFSDEGNYKINFEIPSLGILESESFSIAVSEEPSGEEMPEEREA